MYRLSSPGQLSFEEFYLPFGGKLSRSNRWVQLSDLIPWEQMERQYAEAFSENGAPGKSLRMALGALIIKEKLGLSDRETIEQIRENPYLQYFLGLSEYTEKVPFDASSLVHFRKRLKAELVQDLNEMLIEQTQKATQSVEPPAQEQNDDDDGPPPSPPNQGKLVFDATCAPADIRYPTDLNLLNQSREISEQILDKLYAPLTDKLKRKPRTYRRKARQSYLKVAKQRKSKRKVRRKAVGQQLRYLRRNLKHLEQLLDEYGASLTWLSQRQYRSLLVIQEVYRQQLSMYDRQTHQVEHRIVSVTQPHIRPIVRGKAGASVEFGAKLSISYVDGYLRLDHMSWENFNESGDLIGQIEAYKARTGYYPESVHGDKIYRTQVNRAWCRDRGIRLTGARLGRPKKNPSRAEKNQAKADANYRNVIEGKFGQGKRRFSLGLVMTKLAETSECAISMTILVMNLERLLWQIIFVFLSLLRFFNPTLRGYLCLLRKRLTLSASQKDDTHCLRLWPTPRRELAC